MTSHAPDTRPAKEIVHIIFSSHRLNEQPPPEGSMVAVVKFARANNEFADACSCLRNLERVYQVVWVEGGRVMNFDPDLRKAELDQARAVARSLSDGWAKKVVIYNERVEKVSLSDAETVLEE